MSLAVLLLASSAFSASAAAWHALEAGAGIPEPASLRVLASDAGGVSLRASFKGFWLNPKTHPYAGSYVTPEIPGCGMSAPVGSPALPVLRRFIVAPSDAAVSLSVAGAPRLFTLEPGRTQAFFPRQRPLSKAPNRSKLIPFDFDVTAYSANAFFPATPCRLTEAGALAGQRILLVEVFPIAVNPVSLGLRVYPDLSIRLAFSRSGAALKRAADSPLTLLQQELLSGVAVNATPAASLRGVKGALPRFLILAPDAWLAALAPLVSHRQARGWTVDLFGTGTAGSTLSAVRAFIQGRYDNLATRPDALLLVGDTPQIPCFTGTQTDNPDTDLYFGCMDGATDWQPEFPVGRLSVSTPEALRHVLEKILAYETVPPDLWMSQAVFMASEDNHAITEGTHNAVIAAWLDPLGYQSDKLYTANKAATPAQVSAAFNAGRILGVYSGHGDTGYWADGPVFYKSNVLALTNSNRYPVVFSFTCLTGRFSLNECFAETWLRAPDKAAAGILASSVTSYWDEDDIFERMIFESLFKEGLRRYGEAILRAKYRLIETYGLTDTVIRYFEQYNYLGDPLTPLRQSCLSIVTPPDLPTGRAGQPYSETIKGTGGTEPYAWSLASPPPDGLALDATNGIFSGVPSAAVTNAGFTVTLTDANLAVTSRTFRLHVAGEPLRITDGTNAGPFLAGAPFLATLSAAGGIGPYQWRFLHRGQYAAWTNTGFWTGTPRATGWSGDERSWKVTLPWKFRFYEKKHAVLWVNSNGYIDFGSGASQWDNSTAGLLKRTRIAPLWDDIRVTNVFLNITDSFVAIRWTGATFSSPKPVDFEAILKRNGKILFAYTGMKNKLSPTIGISAGDGTNMTLAVFNGAPTLPAGQGVKFAWQPPMPPGVCLSVDGVLSGTVAGAVTRTVPVVVQDQSVPAQTATALLTLRIE